jgi:hypothetical protein
MMELANKMFGFVVVMSFIAGYGFISASEAQFNPVHILHMGSMIFLYLIYLEVVDSNAV